MPIECLDDEIDIDETPTRPECPRTKSATRLRMNAIDRLLLEYVSDNEPPTTPAAK